MFSCVANARKCNARDGALDRDMHGPITGAMHGPITGAIHGPITVHGPITGAIHGPITGAIHGPIYAGANTLAPAIGHFYFTVHNDK